MQMNLKKLKKSFSGIGISATYLKILMLKNKENKIKKESAFKKIMKIFKPTPLANEVQKIKLQEAHEQAIREILDQMADEDGMVKTYRGGRFERIETVQEESTRKKKQTQQSKMIEKAMKKENGERAAEYLDIEEDNLLQAKWIDHGSQSRDLTTLVMNIFLRKLNVGLSLETAQLISLDGNSIYIVVKADLKDLKKIAEESQYSMQLAIGLTDLSSLEPCDKYLRPLRKCDSESTEINELQKSLEEYYAIIEGNIQELLNEKPLEYNNDGLAIGEITNQEWETYHQYLVLLKEGYEDFKSHTYNKPHIKGVHLKTLALKCLSEVNKNRNNKGKLYNLWDRSGIEYPIGAYADFDDSPDIEFYWRQYIQDETLNRNIFRDTDKIKLTHVLIQKIINNKQLADNGFINSFLNFHNNFELYGESRFEEDERESKVDKKERDLITKILFAKEIPKGLSKMWRNIIFPPVTKIRNYFGEKIGLYFAFLSFYSLMLIIPSLVCIPVFVIQVLYTDGQTVVDVINIAYTVIMVIWSAVFYEYWKRREITYAVEWGQTDFEEDEVEKVTFRGIFRRSPVHDKSEKYFSRFRRGIRVFISILITLLLIAIDIAIIVGLFRLRYYLYNQWKNYWYADYSITVVSVINAIVIFIFNYIFFYVSFVLTNFENFKTQTEFEKSIIIKNFIFQFVNCYNSLFYIAFLKRDIEGCLDYNPQGKLTLSKDYLCFNEIYVQLRSIFVLAIIKNFYEIGAPLIFGLLNSRSKQKTYKKLEEAKVDKQKLILRIEKNVDKSAYGYEDLDGTYYDYQEVLIQMGYILLFGLSFPLCIILALINNIIEHQVDRAKMLYLTRRPTPIGGENIGSWRIIFYVLMIVGVFCYAGILCITSLTFSSNTKDSFTEFVWCSIIFLMLKWIISYMIPDIPEKLIIIMKRHRFLIDKYLVGMPEASADDKAKASKTLTNLAVHCSHQDYIMNKSSCEVSADVKEGKSGYDRKKSKLMLSGKATTMQTANKSVPVIQKGHNVGAYNPKLDKESSSFVSDFVSDTDLQIGSDEEEDGNSSGANESNNQSEESDN